MPGRPTAPSIAGCGTARAEAERLERSRPGWVVLYGTGSRRFYAIAWPAPEPTVVFAPTAEELQERMDAELALRCRTTHLPLPPPTP